MISYFLKVTVCWGLFYLLYTLFLSKETFFTANRWYLLVTLILGLFIPVVLIDFTDFFIETPTTPLYLQPIVDKVQDLDYAVSTQTIQRSSANYWLWLLGAVYLIGCLVTTCKFVVGLKKIYRLYSLGEVYTKEKYSLVITKYAHLPFSFFNYLFWSQDTYIENTDAEKIMTHEIAHINQWHSIDILFLEVLGILFWFSPPIYWYKKSLRATHEFLADACVLKSTQTKQYGHLLIKHAQSGLQMALANNFIHSELKKRIVMMTKKKSADHALLKYLPALPLLLLMTMVFSNPQVRANLEETAKMSLRYFNLAEIELPVAPALLTWVNTGFNEEKAKEVVRASFKNGNKNINLQQLQPSVSQMHAAEQEQKMKELHRANLYLKRKFPEQELVIQKLTKEVAAEFNYSLRFHEDGETIIYDFTNKIPEQDKTQKMWYVVNGKILGYAEIDIIPSSDINNITILSSIEAMAQFGEEEGKDGAILIESDLWQVIEEADKNTLERKTTSFQTPDYTTSKFDGFNIERSKVQEKGTLLIINGVEFGNTIGGFTFAHEEVNNTKRISPEEAIERYGQKGSKGATLIELNEPYAAVKDAWGNYSIIEKDTYLSDFFIEERKLFQIVETMPQFPDGPQGLEVFINTHLQYPESAKILAMEGTVLVQFIVEKNGSISDPVLSNTVEPTLDQEALRIIRLMKEKNIQWNPGWQNGETVRVIITLPIAFKIKKPSPLKVPTLLHIERDSFKTPIINNQDMPVYVNGLPYTSKEKIAPDLIEHLQVVKGMKARIKYGEAGKKGVIEITLKKGASLFNKLPLIEE